MLKAAGKVIQIGIDTRGKIFINFENLRIYEFPVAALEVEIFKYDIAPPIIGRIPVGSGLLRSLNQRSPSVKMAGLIS